MDETKAQEGQTTDAAHAEGVRAFAAVDPAPGDRAVLNNLDQQAPAAPAPDPAAQMAEARAANPPVDAASTAWLDKSKPADASAAAPAPAEAPAPEPAAVTMPAPEGAQPDQTAAAPVATEVPGPTVTPIDTLNPAAEATPDGQATSFTPSGMPAQGVPASVEPPVTPAARGGGLLSGLRQIPGNMMSSMFGHNKPAEAQPGTPTETPAEKPAA